MSKCILGFLGAFLLGSFSFAYVNCNNYCADRYLDSSAVEACEVGVRAIVKYKYLDEASAKCRKEFEKKSLVSYCEGSAQNYKLFCM